MIKQKFAKLIQNNIFYIVLLANFLFQYVQSYYIFPFKFLKPDLSELYKTFPNYSKEEVYLSYLNMGWLYTHIKLPNSKIYEIFFKVDEKCSFNTNTSCITNFKSNIFDKFNHKNENISNVMNIIMDSPPKDECTNIKIGLAMPGYQGPGKCINIVNEVKKNDNRVNLTTFTFDFYEDTEKKDKGFDGELIIGGLPHETEPEYFNESDFITVNNYVGPYYYIDGEGDDEDEDDDDDDTWDGKYINFTLQFKKVFFYVNNSNISENKIFINTTESEEGTIDFEIGLSKCPFSYYSLIKSIFFQQYLTINTCKETRISGGFYAILCYKNKINTKDFYNKFPTIYFESVDFNYTFTLTSKDLFIEKDEFLYFALVSQNEKLNNWRFGQPFLKKYRLVFNQDRKSIGYYIKHKEKEYTPEKGKKNLSLGIILVIAGAVLLIVETVIAVVCIKKYKCLNRKKRANELMDDNYDYSSNVNPEENKAIN